MSRAALCTLVVVSSLLVPVVAAAEECSWMPTARIDEAFPDRAPWSVLAGGQGRCKFLSDTRVPASSLSLTQIVRASPAEAEKYVAAVGGGMAASYQVTPLPALGSAGVAVRQSAPDSRMLTLIGHRGEVVVMTQLSFVGGVSEAQQAKAQELTEQTFAADTGGGMQLPE